MMREGVPTRAERIENGVAVSRRDVMRLGAGGIGAAIVPGLWVGRGGRLAGAQEGGEMVFRLPSFEPDSLDPTKGGPGYQEYQNLYEPLVDAYAKDGQIRPLAAESYTTSEDGLTLTFTLRPGLAWSDGQPLVAEDFRYAWLRQLDPATAAYTPDEFFAIRNAREYNSGAITDQSEVGIRAPDDRTLVVTLAEPAVYFLRLVGSSSYFPVRRDIIEEHGDRWVEAGTFVGNGPYALESWEHDQRLVMVKNPSYAGPWRETRLVDRIEFTVFQDPWSGAVPAYEAGEVDAASAPAAELDRLRADPELGQQLHQLPISGAVCMVLDTANPPTDDVRVRQALARAIDKDTLANQVLRGAYAPAASFSPPDLAGHDPSSSLAYDPEVAKALLAEAGYADATGFPSFTLTYWTQERESLIAQAISTMWKQNLGITVDLEPLEPQAMRDYRISRAEQPFNAYLALNWSGIADPSQFHNLQLDPSYEPERSQEQLNDPNIPTPDPENTATFRALQNYVKVNLVRPVNAPHMWHAAMQSESCELTVLGQHYWNLVDKRLI
jgi:oligopeptide transport system substrate-binding protein